MITLTLPYPPSANRYWRTAVVCGRAQTYPSKDAKEFKCSVALACRRAGVMKPLAGRVAIGIQLYPNRPQDWVKRARKDPASWDDDVRCIDLDNANKVLLDALKGIVIEDDKWVRRLVSERMEPDGEGRVVVTITPIALPVVQPDLIEAASA